MSSVRVSVEWFFGDIKNYFKFLAFKMNLKIQLSAVGKSFIVCTILQKARSCLYGFLNSRSYEIDRPSLIWMGTCFGIQLFIVLKLYFT